MNLDIMPGTYSPVNAEIWFEFSATQSNYNDFKYLFNVNSIDYSNVSTQIGTFKIPPRPINGNGLFTPHKLLRSELSYDINPLTQVPIDCDNSIIKYNIDYGYEYNPDIRYDFAYYGTGGSLGLSFNTSLPFEIGDIISINKDNKQSNPQYDGTCSVTAIFELGLLHLIEVDKVFVTSSVTDGGGVIDFLRRSEGSTDNYYAYNGTRQYNEIKTNFSNTRVFYLDENTALPLTNYKVGRDNFTTILDANAKTIFSNQYETLSLLVDQPSNNQIILNPTMSFSAGQWSSFGPDGCNVECKLFNDNTLKLVVPDVSCGSAAQLATNAAVFIPGRTYRVVYTISNINNPSGSFAYCRARIGSGSYGSANTFTGTFTEDLVCGAGTSFTLEMNLADADTGGYGAHSITVTSVYAYDLSSLNLLYLTYDSNKIYNGGTYSTLDKTLHKRIDIPAGTQNLIDMGLSMSSVSYYTVSLLDQDSNYKFSQLYKIVDNCSPYEKNWRVMFQNRHGGFDYWNFNYKSTNTLSNKRNEWRKVLNYDYNVGARQDTILSQKANETWIISSDWISEYDSKYLKELITSPEAYIFDEDDNVYYPIIIIDDNYTVKTSIDNKLFCVILTFRFAYDINLQQS